MISFDEGGGSYGNVDLSPIYKSLNILNINTQSIWDYMTNMTGTISYSTPYLESYRTENENYMYNITGNLPIVSGGGYKFINGIHSLTSKFLNSTNATELKLDYLEEFSFNTFEKVSIFSLTGARMRLNLFDSCYANVSGRILDDNSFVDGNVSISAFQFYHVINTCINLFAANNFVNVNCAEMSYAGFAANLYVNLTCNKLISATFGSNKLCKLDLGDISVLSIDSAQILNLNCAEITSFDCKNIYKGNIDAYQISNITVSNNSSLNINCVNFMAGDIRDNARILINANTIEDFTFVNDMLSISCLSGNSLTLEKIGGDDYIFASGLINTMKNCNVYNGTMFLSGNEITNCNFQSINGHISFNDMDSCSFIDCSDLTVYARTLKSVCFTRCSNIVIHGDLVHMPTMSSCDSIGFFYREIQAERIPLFYSCGVISLSDLKPTAGHGACYELAYPDNWNNKLYILENPLSQGQPASDISAYGVRFVTDSSATGPLVSHIKLNYAIWHTNN